MLKLSKETCDKIDQLVSLQEDVDSRLSKESDGAYSLCVGIELKLQLYAHMFHQHDLAELESFVGPIRLNHEYEDGTKSYHFMLTDSTLGCIVMPADTTDSRTTGGEADDVCIDKEA